MANTFLYANNAKSALAGAITNTATTANLTSGSGVLFPNPAAGQQFALTFVDAATGLLNEIVYVTARSGDTITTMVRGQEGTTALNWSAGDLASSLLTAGNMSAAVQGGVSDTNIQAQAGNYAQDTGAANALVVALTPVLASHTVGLPIRVRVAHNNTGPATLNPGPSAVSINKNNNKALIYGDLVGGAIYTFIYNGTTYDLMEIQGAAQGGVISIAAPASVPNTGTPTVLLVSPIAGLIGVTYDFGTGNSFIDIIAYFQFGTPVVIGSVNEGAPGTRTYTSQSVTGSLLMALAGAPGTALPAVFGFRIGA